jgi:thiamine-phosphate pyrophosphorylase
MISLPRLYAIADATFGDPFRLAQELFGGGARLVQVRNKRVSAGELLSQVESILAIAPKDAHVLVNDRLDVALIGNASGVHLGQTDLPPATARRILGADRVVGVSTHNMEQALGADNLAVDYIAVGPIFATSTKENPDPVVGLENLAAICKAVHKPVVAIGGIKLENARLAIEAGARCVAVIRDLLEDTDVAGRARRWNEILNTL